MLIFKRPWTTQPQGAVGVDWGSSLSFGLINGIARITSGAVVGAKPLYAGASDIATSYGILTKLSGSSSGIQIPDVSLTSAVSITWAGQITSQSGEMLFEHSATADSNVGFYFYGLSAASARCQIKIDGGSVQTSDVSYTFPSVLSMYTLVVDAVRPGWQLWVNGVNAINTTFLRAGAFTKQTLNVGCRNGTSLSSDGVFGALFVHNRSLSAAEIAMLHKNVWQLLAPRRIYIPTSTAAATGAPTLSDLKAASVTTTTVQGTYDYAF